MNGGTMANTPYKTPPTARLTVSSLLSPPELKRSESFSSTGAPIHLYPSFSSFNSDHPQASLMAGPAPLKGTAPSTRDAYASPPISPFQSQEQKENTDCGEVGAVVRDPPLYPPSDAASPLVADEPLFPPESVDTIAQNVITEHMNSEEFANLQSKPAREDYELAVSLVSTISQEFRKDPRAWFRREREFDNRYGNRSQAQKQRAPLKKLAPAPSTGVRKQKPALPRIPRAPRAPKRTPPNRMYDAFDHAPMSVSPRPARPATNRDDTDYRSIPDCSPPLDTLPPGNKVLKADWKGQVLDLSNDPDRALLHEAELNLASTLRLSCATYLCSKRRIFQARIEALRIGKEFRKTDAQQACKIDVNKASKLWQAYEKVGWFKPEYFRQYLTR